MFRLCFNTFESIEIYMTYNDNSAIIPQHVNFSIGDFNFTVYSIVF